MLYKLFKYNIASDDEHLCLEHENKNFVINEAIRLSKEAGNYWTFRAEKWENGKMVGAWRFFQNGKEFTDRLRKALAKYKEGDISNE